MKNENSVNIKENGQQLYALENLDDYKVHEDDTDVRGWTLQTSTGENIGEVKNLIVNPELKRVTYLEVDLDDSLNGYRNLSYRNRIPSDYHSYYGTDKDQSIIVPIGMIEIDAENEKVVASSNFDLPHFSNSPRYKGIQRTSIVPIYELLVVRYHANEDEELEKQYSDEHYNISQFKSSNYAPDRSFYKTDLFSNGGFFNRYKRKTANPSMSKFVTGMPGK